MATALCLAVHGCADPTGGAVELSWALRSTEGQPVSDCADGRITRIRLTWDDGITPGFQSFRCDANHGVTSFDVPTGAVALAIAPECLDGALADAGSYLAPPPIVRQVGLGQAVTLDALQLIVRVAPSECTQQPCVCVR